MSADPVIDVCELADTYPKTAGSAVAAHGFNTVLHR